MILVLLVLLIPLIAQQFTDEVKWTLGDFIIGGMLLTGLSFTVDYVLLNHKGNVRKRLFVLLVIIIFVFVWVELAVGIF